MGRPEPWVVNVPNSISMLREYALVQTDDARHVAPYLTCALNSLVELSTEAPKLWQQFAHLAEEDMRLRNAAIDAEKQTAHARDAMERALELMLGGHHEDAVEVLNDAVEALK